MDSTTTTTSSSSTGRERRSSSSSTTSTLLSPPLQTLVDKAEKERLVYEDPWSRIPNAFKVIIRPSSSRLGRKQGVQKREVQHDTPVPETTAAAAGRKTHLLLPTSLQRLVDKQETERNLYEDSWARIPRALKRMKGDHKTGTE